MYFKAIFKCVIVSLMVSKFNVSLIILALYCGAGWPKITASHWVDGYGCVICSHDYCHGSDRMYMFIFI